MFSNGYGQPGQGMPGQMMAPPWGQGTPTPQSYNAPINPAMMMAPPWGSGGQQAGFNPQQFQVLPRQAMSMQGGYTTPNGQGSPWATSNVQISQTGQLIRNFFYGNYSTQPAIQQPSFGQGGMNPMMNQPYGNGMAQQNINFGGMQAPFGSSYQQGGMGQQSASTIINVFGNLSNGLARSFGISGPQSFGGNPYDQPPFGMGGYGHNGQMGPYGPGQMGPGGGYYDAQFANLQQGQQMILMSMATMLMAMRALVNRQNQPQFPPGFDFPFDPNLINLPVDPPVIDDIPVVDNTPAPPSGPSSDELMLLLSQFLNGGNGNITLDDINNPPFGNGTDDNTLNGTDVYINPDDGGVSDPTTTGGSAVGDPHYTTLHGKRYEFQGDDMNNHGEFYLHTSSALAETVVEFFKWSESNGTDVTVQRNMALQTSGRSIDGRKIDTMKIMVGIDGVTVNGEAVELSVGESIEKFDTGFLDENGKKVFGTLKRTKDNEYIINAGEYTHTVTMMGSGDRAYINTATHVNAIGNMVDGADEGLIGEGSYYDFSEDPELNNDRGVHLNGLDALRHRDNVSLYKVNTLWGGGSDLSKLGEDLTQRPEWGHQAGVDASANE